MVLNYKSAFEVFVMIPKVPEHQVDNPKAALNDVGDSLCSMRVASLKLASWSASSANAQVTLGKSLPAYVLSKDPIQTDIPKFKNAAFEQKASYL